MKATLDSENMAKAVSAFRKLGGGKSKKIYLHVSKQNIMSIIENSVTYIRYSFPVSDASPGLVGLTPAVVMGLPAIKDKQYTLELINNTLKVTSRVEHKFYALDSSKEEVKAPEIEASETELTGKSVGKLHRAMEKVNFLLIDTDNNNPPVLIENTKKAFTVKLADAVHCALYTFPSLGNISFSFFLPLQTLKTCVANIHSGAKLLCNESMFFLKSDELSTTIPIIEQGIEQIKQTAGFDNPEHYKEGKIVLDKAKLVETLSTMGFVSDRNDVVKFSAKGNTISLSLETTSGKSKGTVECENTVGKVDMIMPLVILKDILASVSFNDELEIFIESNANHYMVKNSSKHGSVVCIGATQ